MFLCLQLTLAHCLERFCLTLDPVTALEAEGILLTNQGVNSLHKDRGRAYDPTETSPQI